jgi:hypothetical protein
LSGGQERAVEWHLGIILSTDNPLGNFTWRITGIYYGEMKNILFDQTTILFFSPRSKMDGEGG